MAVFLRVFGVLLLATAATAYSDDRYDQLRQQAAEYYSEQAYDQAWKAWDEASHLDVPPEDRRTLAFYLADALWRSHPAAAYVTEARQELQALAGTGTISDSLAAEASESLGDSWLALDDNWDRAWAEYRRALEFWKPSTSSDPGRTRYLGIVWKATRPPGEYERGERVPLDVLESAFRIAHTNEELARAHFFLGCWYAETPDSLSLRRAGAEFQAAVDAGRDTAVYEAALYRLAQWNLVAGESYWGLDGGLTAGPDYTRALELFQRFVAEFPNSVFTDGARKKIAELTQPVLEMQIPHQFLPGGSPRLHLHWRNASAVELTLQRVDLGRDFRPNAQIDPYHWVDAIRLPTGPAIRQWKEADTVAPAHAPVDREVVMDPIDQPGTYLVEARAGGVAVRELLVVTTAAAAFRAWGDDAVGFFCDAQTGLAIAHASATIWQAIRNGTQWTWRAASGVSGMDGLVRCTFPGTAGWGGGDQLLFGWAGDQPIVANATVPAESSQRIWRVGIFPDRAICRPGDTVHWMMLARQLEGGKSLTPMDAALDFTIRDPNGRSVGTGTATLGEFGSSVRSFTSGVDSTEGEYSITVAQKGEDIGGAAMFCIAAGRSPSVASGSPSSAPAPKPNGSSGIVVSLSPAMQLVAPGEAVSLGIKTHVGAGSPVATSGTLTISRLQWTETWIDSKGRQVAVHGPERSSQRSSATRNQQGWRLLKQQYIPDIVAEDKVSTGPDGIGSYRFRPGEAGLYRVEWSSMEGAVSAWTDIWAASRSGAGLAGHSDGVSIVVNSHSIPVDGKIPILLVTNGPNRDVLLLAHAGAKVFQATVFHLDGTSRLVKLDASGWGADVWLTACMINEYECFSDIAEVEMAGARNALHIEARANIRPDQSGDIRIIAATADGEPARAEIALGISSGGDPRRADVESLEDFFLCAQPARMGRITSSLSIRPFSNQEGQARSSGSSIPGLHRVFSRGAAGNYAAPAIRTVAAGMSATPAPAASEMPGSRVSVFQAGLGTSPDANTLWFPGIVTDASGKANTNVKFPGIATDWRVALWGATPANQFGCTVTSLRTSVPPAEPVKRQRSKK
jgi:tetratricopeptide (TPR) repeat protein